MPVELASRETPEAEFASLVDEIAANPGRQEELIGLLRENHPVYDQRSGAAIVRMRGWILLAFARTVLPESGLPYVLEELELGIDPYLVAAASRALRSHPRPTADFAPCVMRALTHIRYRNQKVSFERYGDYGLSGPGITTPVDEALQTLAWLGPHARNILGEIQALCSEQALPGNVRSRLKKIVKAVREAGSTTEAAGENCCALPASWNRALVWIPTLRREGKSLREVEFEDQDGGPVRFIHFFRDRPSIVAFFYTRCDNPYKCSLTVTKLARVQKILRERGLQERIQTAAITYDPDFDLPERLKTYGSDRGVSVDDRHKILRATQGADTLRRHFELGVSFVESVVNRHRIELYILDGKGQMAASYTRLHWDEQEVVEKAMALEKEYTEPRDAVVSPETPALFAQARAAGTFLGFLPSLGVALFPKCPVCWAAYLSFFGISWLAPLLSDARLEWLLVTAMAINLASVWWRGRFLKRMWPFYLVSTGALAIVLSTYEINWTLLADFGVGLTLVGSLANALSPVTRYPLLAQGEMVKGASL